MGGEQKWVSHGINEYNQMRARAKSGVIYQPLVIV